MYLWDPYSLDQHLATLTSFSQQVSEKTKVEKLVGRGKDQEATYQLPSRAALTKKSGKINVIYS